ncbi:hypothetical protein [Roseibium aggregatum]|uniref:Uncharacterized protein n=1 Tax=Roseibium aggregatum TaxID=187304 RepID=A0A926NUZ5_9HYPH|nr:hypothetical protein [Roseibium aggregatum]MBD1544891.1 hypothetical protein [Roseibium aggregatum]
MWLETIAALLFLGGLWPLWLILAILWGGLKAVFIFGIGIIGLFHLDTVTSESLLSVPLSAVIEGASAAWSIPSWAWDWAKYSHPIIASILGLIGLGMMNN